ncbi:MAG: hypothetical protein JXB85_00805 [Anaerolineales bacterium]|nr:hypothetical protein [Anaerolineales bacterium]
MYWLLILEVILFVVGAWAFVTARVPGRLLGLAEYRIEGPAIRGMGLLLLLPLVADFLLGRLVPLLDESGVLAVMIGQALLAGIVISIAVTIIRRNRRRAKAPQDAFEKRILEEVERSKEVE